MSVPRVTKAIDPTARVQPPFTVVAFYDDLLAGHHAMATYEKLVNRFGREFTFRQQLWKLEAIEHAPSRDEAAEQAVEADMIVVSLHNATLPRNFCPWLGTWVAKKGRKDRALVAIFDPASGDPGPVQRCLQQVATDHGMDFIANNSCGTDEPPASCLVPESPYRNWERWGLNE